MQPSNNLINFIKCKEKFLPSVEFDKIGQIWNIGYGSTHYENGKSVFADDPDITEEQATELLHYYVDVCANAIHDHITQTLSQNQFDALCDFIYNCGKNAFINSTLLKVVNIDPNDNDKIKNQLMRWVKANGSFCQGLANRRRAECDMYINCIYS